MTIPTVIESKLTSWNHPKPDVVASYQVCGYRVSFVTAGQARNTVGEEVRINQQGSYSNSQAGKLNDMFMNKARKDCLWDGFTISVKVCKTWFKSQGTHCGKLTKPNTEQAP